MKIVSKILAIILMSGIFMFSSCILANASASNDQVGQIVRIFGDVTIDGGDMVTGNVVAVFGSIHINGPVMGNVVSILGDVDVNQQVMGNVVSATGRVNVGEGGSVMGNVVDPLHGRYGKGVYVTGFDVPFFRLNQWWSLGSLFSSLISSLILFLFSALVYVIMPAKVAEMADTVEPRLGKRLGIGFLTLIASPIAMVILTILLAITIIGLIVIPFIWIAYALAGFVALVPMYDYLGRKIAGLFGSQGINGTASIAAGIFTLWLIKAVTSFGGIFTGWIYGLLSFVIFILGTGTLIDYIASSRKRTPVYPSEKIND